MHLHLTPQPTRLRQPKRQIQHVILVIARLPNLIVHLLAPHNDVAGRAGAASAARALHLEVVRLRDVEQVFAVADLEGVFAPFFVDEGHVALFARWGLLEFAVAVGTCGGERSDVGLVVFQSQLPR